MFLVKTGALAAEAGISPAKCFGANGQALPGNRARHLFPDRGDGRRRSPGKFTIPTARFGPTRPSGFWEKGNTVVATFTTDGSGHFSVYLQPGAYRVRRQGADDSEGEDQGLSAARPARRPLDEEIGRVLS